MEANSTQQEILLMTGGSFLSGQLEKRADADKDKPLTDRQLLEEACWNGMIRDILPEIYGEENSKLFLWRIREASAFLELELGESPVVIEEAFSLDPSAYLRLQVYN